MHYGIISIVNRSVSTGLAAERQAYILQTVARQGPVRTAGLIARFGISPATARRDLTSLAKEGLIRRVHGGAVAIQTTPLSPNSIVSREADDSPRVRVGRAAAGLVAKGETVFLGPGLLGMEVARFLLEIQPEITLITNDLGLAHWAAQNRSFPRHTLIVTGGQAGERGGGLMGPLFRASLANLRPNHVMLELGGVSAVEGITDDSLAWAEEIQVLFEIGAQTVILALPEQVGRVAAAHVAPISELDVLVTTREAPAPILWDLSEAGVRVVLA